MAARQIDLLCAPQLMDATRPSKFARPYMSRLRRKLWEFIRSYLERAGFAGLSAGSGA